jgi:ferritin
VTIYDLLLCAFVKKQGGYMISKTMATAINKQINREFYSAYLYLAMANDAMEKGYKGAANWFNVQFKEEQGHALKFAHYLQDQNAKVTLFAIEQPALAWADITAMFKDALTHEKKVTAWINELADLALTEKDFATQNMLKWFIDEQIEEEGNVTDILWMLDMCGTSKSAFYLADKKLGKRE